jgi:L-lactate dehydrogenase complex protein LldE
MRIALFIPCFIDQLFPRVGISVVDVLERLGHQVEFHESITCCGQPAFNSGFWEEARQVAEPVIRKLQKAEAVVIPSGSCGAMIRVFYPQLFANTPLHEDAQALSAKTFEFSEFLVDKLGVSDVGARLDTTATFHDGCHGLRELDVKSQPRKLLEKVKGLKLVEMNDTATCCGFGGTFAVKFPMISTAMGDAKLANASATNADCIVSNDSSCLMHLQGMIDRQGLKLKTLHLAEVLASR